ncbi:hypothetical protein GIB67_001978 [Kingdonia uniflora]|uniref:MULE transposase domain-containing protein n=1 Tax=Kingdonia uniflora TaxID=39325 RepID=A0A7J7M9Y6_9MAGN|nr:hypothetical protein GIB67_001978 [Kingdonia uniflora]
MQELCRQVLLSNPGSIAKCGCDPHTKMWIGTCIAFKASLDGFVQGCRSIVGLDGCFLKGKYGGQCLEIVSLDGSNGLFPVAFYLYRSECTETWTTFLEMLAPFLTMHPSKLTFNSDGQKGLVESVSQIFLQQNHRFCFRHMWKNFKKEFRGLHLERSCWDAAKAFIKTDKKIFLDQLERYQPDAKAWFCSKYHMVAAYRRSYKGSALPISDPSLWEKPNSDMLPPPLERGTGRPRKTYKGPPPAAPRPRNSQPTTRTDRRGSRPRGSIPRNNSPTRVGVGIRVGVGMRGRGTRGGVARGGAARGSVVGGGATRARQQSTNNPRGGVNKSRGGLTGGGATRVHTQASQQSTNNARGGLTGVGAARLHTQASQQSTSNARGGLTGGGAARDHTQASQQSTNNARCGLTRGGAARVHTQDSQQSTNNARGGLTRGGILFSQPSQGSGITQALKNVNPYKKDKWII